MFFVDRANLGLELGLGLHVATQGMGLELGWGSGLLSDKLIFNQIIQ